MIMLDEEKVGIFYQVTKMWDEEKLETSTHIK